MFDNKIFIQGIKEVVCKIHNIIEAEFNEKYNKGYGKPVYRKDKTVRVYEGISIRKNI